jgi:predicted TIM-barrel fold metal-dependent hydrolase
MIQTIMKFRLIYFFILTSIISLGLEMTIAQTPPNKILLKDYRPRSIYNIPKTEIKKAKFSAIDVHAHPYAKTNEEIVNWVKNMDEVGVEKSIVLTGATGALFDSIYAEYANYPDRFEVWCGFDYTGYDEPGFGPAAVAELERCARVGAKGVGELGDKGKGLFYSKPVKAWGMHLDDPRMNPLLKKCGELDLPINIHVGEPLWFYQPMDSTNDGLMCLMG